MSNRLGGKQGTAYLGTNANQPPNMTFNNRPPTQYDFQNHSVGDIWLDSTAPDIQKVWMLVSLEGTGTSMGQLGHWIQLSAYIYNPSGIFTWENGVNGTNFVVGHGYFQTSDPLTMTLPATANLGDMIAISNPISYATNGWVIAQNAGQSIDYEDQTTTVGVGGSLSSTAPEFYYPAFLVCFLGGAASKWQVINSGVSLTVI